MCNSRSQQHLTLALFGTIKPLEIRGYPDLYHVVAKTVLNDEIVTELYGLVTC